MALIDDVVAKGSLQLTGMRSINVTKRVLQILDLLDSDPDLYALISLMTRDVNSHTFIVAIALDDLAFIFLLPSWTQGGW